MGREVQERHAGGGRDRPLQRCQKTVPEVTDQIDRARLLRNVHGINLGARSNIQSSQQTTVGPAAAATDLRRWLERDVAELLGGADRVALLDYPNHVNAGDAAIWLGERVLLERLETEVVYAADQRGYSPERLRRVHPDGPILLHGGGNLGDLYPRHHQLRERVVADFPDRRVIQLPQSAHFSSQARYEATAALFHRHPALTVLIRGNANLLLHRDLADDMRLCPDGAFSLAGLGPLMSPTDDRTLWLARTDREHTTPPSGTPSGVLRTDWPRPPSGWHRRRLLSRATSLLLERLPAPTAVDGGNLMLFDRLAANRVATALATVGAHRSIVTDRLHGHIACLLAERPHVVYDNANGKVGDFVHTFTAAIPSVRWAEDARRALELARRA